MQSINTMTHRGIISTVLLLFIGLSTSFSYSGNNQRKPNIIIFYLDDMGYAQPSCYGGKLIETPNIDKLAANGIDFTDGHGSAPICGPSRVGLMTGRYQARTGQDSNGKLLDRELLIDEVPLAQLHKKLFY